MTDSTLTLREFFDANIEDFSSRVGPGIDAYQEAKSVRQSIEQDSRLIRWPWVRDAVVEKATGILDLNLLDIIVSGWKKYMQISKYADRKKYGTEEAILVPLAEHTIESKQSPYVEVLLRDHPVGRVVFDLSLSLTLEGFVLKIQDGSIREIQSGSGKGIGELSLSGQSIYKKESKPLHLPGHLSLGRGIPL